VSLHVRRDGDRSGCSWAHERPSPPPVPRLLHPPQDLTSSSFPSPQDLTSSSFPSPQDLVRLLGADDAVVVTSNAQLSATPAFGYYVDQELASPALRDWQSVRRVVMKRPGLATVEKFLDTAGASLFISSAFHPPYTEKMADVAEGLKMPAAVVVRRGGLPYVAEPLGHATARVNWVLRAERRLQNTGVEWPHDALFSSLVSDTSLYQPGSPESCSRSARKHQGWRARWRSPSAASARRRCCAACRSRTARTCARRSPSASLTSVRRRRRRRRGASSQTARGSLRRYGDAKVESWSGTARQKRVLE
jgi:hypothetical protein